MSFCSFFFCDMYFGEDPKQTNHEWGTGKEGRREGRREKGEKRGGSGRRDEKQAESPKGENDAIKNSNHTLTQKHRKDPEKQTNKVWMSSTHWAVWSQQHFQRQESLPTERVEILNRQKQSVKGFPPKWNHQIQFTSQQTKAIRSLHHTLHAPRTQPAQISPIWPNTNLRPAYKQTVIKKRTKANFFPSFLFGSCDFALLLVEKSKRYPH